jgi:hypothetical protein
VLLNFTYKNKAYPAQAEGNRVEACLKSKLCKKAPAEVLLYGFKNKLWGEVYFLIIIFNYFLIYVVDDQQAKFQKYICLKNLKYISIHIFSKIYICHPPPR